MKDINEILFIVQARLSSQRVPRKMIRPFSGTTLTDLCLRKIKDSAIIPLNQFYLCAYEPELQDIGRKHGIQVLERTEKSAKSEGTPLTDIYEWYTLPYKYVVLISACNPLLKVTTIDDFVKTFLEIEPEGLFGVIEKRNFYWTKWGCSMTNFAPGERIMNTKTVEPVYEAAHCLYASRMDLIPKGHFMGKFAINDPALYIIRDELESFDIDYEWQFRMGEILYAQSNNLFRY